MSAGEDFLEPDVMSLEIPADGYEDITQWDDGKVSIDFTPEQAEQFEEFLRNEVLDQ